jgi:hypothetical protein
LSEQLREFSATREDLETSLQACGPLDVARQFGVRFEGALESVGLCVTELAREVPLDHVAL